MLELWIFLILNNPFFMVPETKQQKSSNKISVDETKELNVIL